MSEYLRAAARICSNRLFLWCLLGIPAVYYVQAYWREALFYGEVVHATGLLAVRLLMLVMAITPLSFVFPRAGWLRWLKRRRRYLGVAAFGYALLHLLIYLCGRGSFERIYQDAATLAMFTGWVAFVVMLALAATSNDASMRWLQLGWKRLHKAIYVVAVLTFAHWVLSAFDPFVGYLHLGVLALLESLRLLKLRRSQVRV